MGKKNKNQAANAKGRSKGDGRFVRLDFAMLRGPAYRDLSANDRSVLVEIMARYNGANNRHISMSSREAAALGKMNKTTAEMSLRKLCANGFLMVVTDSQFGTNGRRATEYELTMFPSCEGRPAKRSFQAWTPPAKPVPKNKTSSQSRSTCVPNEGHKPVLRVVS